MKDKLLLIATGIAMAFVAWMFFFLLGKYSITVLMLMFLVGIIFDSKKPKFGQKKNS